MTRTFEIPGSPSAEHQRSQAAQRVAALAEKSALFFSHFEHRARLTLPSSWRVEGQDEPPARFQGGVLAEPKYQAFRHDLLVASFHPSHRAQWTAHELCHALVGFAYRPDASLLFHALAAWLAELLPVTLWYFFDEADVRKCPLHASSGPLFQTHCAACEQAALEGPRPFDRQSEVRLMEGRQFLQRELSAIARSRKRGRPEGTRYATIDLAQDALRYVMHHRARLRASEMERFTAQFFAADQGQHDSLDALEARVIALSEYLCGGREPPTWRATSWDYMAQDVGYRLLSVRADCQGDTAQALDTIINKLATDRSEGGLTNAIESYRSLERNVSTRARGQAQRTLVPTEQMFAVGYQLPLRMGRYVAQLAEGIASACPATWEALGKEQTEVVRSFSVYDPAERTPIGRRFARFLSVHANGPLSDMAKVEAAIQHVAPRDLLTAGLDAREARGDDFEIAQAVELVELDYEVLSVTPECLKQAPKRPETYGILVVRNHESEVDVLELDANTLAILTARRIRGLNRRTSGLNAHTFEQLVDAGVLIPRAYIE